MSHVRWRRGVGGASAAAGLALWALVSLRFQGGGFLDTEAMHFLQHYLSERDLLAKLLDVKINDWGWYQGRELSYLVDWLDAHFILASIRAGFVHFHPPSHYLACAAIALLHWHFGRRHLAALAPGTLVLLAALFLSSSHSMFSTYYRSAKDLVAVALFPLAWLVAAGPGLLRHAPPTAAPSSAFQRLRWTRAGVVFGLGLGMASSDRQGLFFLAALGLVSGLLLALERNPQRLASLLVLAAAAAASGLNNSLLTPALIRAVNHYDPSLEHQGLDFVWAGLRQLLAGEGWSELAGGSSRVADLISHFYGSPGTSAGWLLIAGLAAVLALGTPADAPRKGASLRTRVFAARMGVVFALGVALVCVLSWIMILKEPFMIQRESAILYYFAPVNALVLFASAGAIQLVLLRRPRFEPWLQAGLVGLVAANLLALPDLRDAYLYEGTSWTGYQRAGELRACLRNRDVDAPYLGLDVRESALCRFLLRRVDTRFLSPSRDAAADSALGLRYLEGRELLLDPAEALAWLGRAARSGYVPAQLSLATLDFEPVLPPGSRARPPGPEQRAGWLLEAAGRWSLEGRCLLALAYQRGVGVARDLVRAREWAEACVRQGRERGFGLRRTLRRLEKPEDRRALRSLLGKSGGTGAS